MTDLRSSIERGWSALEPVKDLGKSYPHPSPTTVVKAQQRCEEAIRAFSGYPLLPASVKTEDAESPAAHVNWEQKTATQEKVITELKQNVHDKSADP